MQFMHDALPADPGPWLAAGGLLIGFLFGFSVFRSNFCTMGAISDVLTFGDYRRLRSWLIAIVTAIAGAQLLQWAGIVDLGRSMYLSPSFDWFGNIAGGLMFGFGMVYAGGCAARNLVRAGGGDLRSMLVLIVIGIFAYMALGGIFGPLRAALSALTALDLGRLGLADQSLGTMAAHAFGVSRFAGGGIAIAALIVPLGLYCAADRNFRRSPQHIMAGVAVGVCVIAAWALTGALADDMAARAVVPASLTFVRPAGDTLEWLERATAVPMPGFGVSTVLGVLLGAFAAAKTAGRFHWATFANPADTRRNLMGAALMGVGGVLALGCTVGQGISGLSTLALGSVLTTLALIAGGVIGIKRLERSLLAN